MKDNKLIFYRVKTTLKRTQCKILRSGISLIFLVQWHVQCFVCIPITFTMLLQILIKNMVIRLEIVGIDFLVL